MSFLQQTAQYIYAKHSATAQQPLDHVWVILPTRRAVSVFQQELAALADRPMLAPHMLAVDDFITDAAGVQLIDNVTLLFELYDVFREIDKKLEFEQFVGWASVLLNDLDRIDQYRIDPAYLFEYLTEAKAIERWTPENHQYTPSLTGHTPAVSNYFGLFSNLKAAYFALRNRLLANGLAYRGMAYRLLADDVRVRVLDNPDYEKLYFVGFNALTASEEHIIRVLTNTTKAELIWDLDSYYLDDTEQEAGYFLRQYKNQKGFPGFKNRTGHVGQGEAETVGIGNTLTTTPKQMRMVGVPTASLQAKVAGQLIDQVQEEDPTSRTVIVLADETLLVPVLYSLNESVTELNVTMGLSLRNSLLFTLIDTLFELQRTMMEFKTEGGEVTRVPKFHHRQVVKLLNHPFVRQYEKLHGLMAPDQINELPRPLIDWILSEVVTGKRAYLGEHDMLELGQGDALFEVLFKRWHPGRPADAIESLFTLIDLLREVYRDSQDTIEIEYLYLFFSLLKQLETTLNRQAEHPSANAPTVTVRSFQQFLYELIRQTTIPFTSEGDSRVQLMGLLETRTLDFERVIILSANEGVLPQSRRMNSLIPFDIAIEVGLPTYREQEAVTAYHLYRLLQRASDVTFLYTTTADAYGNSKGEPSRFLRQIEHELVRAANGNIQFSKPLIRPTDGTARAEPVVLSVPKTDTIRQSLKTYLTDKGLYPTALNHFVACSMRFYFERIVGIREEEEVDERIDSAEFGTWLHNTMESLDKNYRMLNRSVTPDVVQAVLEDEYRKLMKGRVADTGYNLLFYQLANELMQAFQTYQNKETIEQGIRVLATERTLVTYLPVDIGGEVVQVKIGGKIDRLEQLANGTIRIVDYKSGVVKLPANIENLAESLTTLADKDNKWEKIRQLWLYKYLILKENLYPDTTVEAGFYSLRTFQKEPKFLTNRVAFSDDNDRDTYINETEALIRQMVQRMFDTTTPFAMTDAIDTCKYCHYTKICGR
ncbi:PD-(D/E)XK nuclease family protein [Fibrella arboris]|uniref:PD-(D/E)XK nuclease family protein n=1 Tax=Fibrella arboris TaxID=3242486 RepID=UPI0035212DF5